MLLKHSFSTLVTRLCGQANFAVSSSPVECYWATLRAVFGRKANHTFKSKVRNTNQNSCIVCG